MTPAIDYAALFAAIPAPCLVLDPELVIVDVNQAYLEVTRRTREDLLGRCVFEAFPGNPADPQADGPRNLRRSLDRVLRHRVRDVMAAQKYDIPVPGSPGAFEERWWSPVNSPVIGAGGEVELIVHRVEDITSYVRTSAAEPGTGAPSDRLQVLEAELFARAEELQRLNDELLTANAEERQVALALQRSMLHTPDAARHQDIAVRYLPAASSLNVCGDWYDIADVSATRLAAAVGDVVGHGLEAAAVMGMLRSALSATIRASEGPAYALETLERYAESVQGALGTTAVKVLIDKRARTVVYSSAGHPPPVLLHTDGSSDLLDKATDPPLCTRSVHIPRSQAAILYSPGDALVLYTDGLIERPGEDIYRGLDRLRAALARSAGGGPEHIADTVLTELGVSDGSARDDTALMVISL